MKTKIALAGQPNCGKSTIFNMLSGIKQHIANYPGVTVDKKSGFFSYKDLDIEMVDLPGTYSFSSYSLEERVAKQFILEESPDLIINIVDASNLKRNLYLTFQLLEIGKPLIVILNMADVAERRGIKVDVNQISQMLNCPVILASGFKKTGKNEILEEIYRISNTKDEYSEFRINYEELEPSIRIIKEKITKDYNINKRWLAIKALEGDNFIIEQLSKDIENIKDDLKHELEHFEAIFNKNIQSFLAAMRYDSAEVVFSKSVKETKKDELTLTDKMDKVILNRWLSFPILFLVIVTIYQLAIVYGYQLTNYTWPYLAAIKNFASSILPAVDIAHVPMITDFGIWIVNSLNALLNYLPIFFILFALIAILEDVGYMPRMAFILDRVFRKYGLHGQSTLPLVLGGAFVGGCAVPGVMSTKGIADDRARMATIFTVPLMNCLAKVPFYTLLLGAFFPNQMSIMMFFISTITIFTALIISKVITSTILKTRETAPFVMELPTYNLPTFKGVLIRAVERVWQYIKKVCTIVLAVAVVLFVMLQFPGLNKEEQAKFDKQEQTILKKFDKDISKTAYHDKFQNRENVAELLNFYSDYRAKKMAGSSTADEEFMKKNEFLYSIVRAKTKDEKTINRALRNLDRGRNRILREQKSIRIENSLLGMIGRSLEPISKFAGFDWKINVAFLSSFAARESAVATLGSIYESGKAENQRAEEAMRENSGYTPLHAAAIIIFMLLTPPCIATMVVVKLQANSYRFMILSLFLPFGLAMLMATIVFSLGTIFNISGFSAMSIYYAVVVLIAIVLGLIPEKRINWKGGLK
ncbi:ferrous iron transport protein B [Campylobacter blaseri]|uniref:Ferrous iron transport protein B n=1 Tax=Campylobacter blaseri TaxID=2042961 RepID=A0A2P8QZ05_9BACT|nr:ferrous iron transport protein B [Campylobacter blaseri]PSM51475.1 ferrous iron transport protein B [Campylobacter blaseri]PSM52924.1 ferrous iron transport protein B [Campylobacter blaseri]QKF86519.1 ferrous iron transport protein B [Campylobacter blaseri]